MIVADLKAEAFQGHTWKEIRDALKAACNTSHSNQYVLAEVVLLELKLSQLKKMMGLDRPMFTKKDVRDMLHPFIYPEGESMESQRAKAFGYGPYGAREKGVVALFEQTNALMAFFEEEDRLQYPEEPVGCRERIWELTDKGQALCRQKAIAQLKRAAAAKNCKPPLRSSKHIMPIQTSPIMSVGLYYSAPYSKAARSCRIST